MIDNGGDVPDAYMPPDDRTREESLFDEIAAMAEHIIKLAEYGQAAIEAIAENSALVDDLGDDFFVWQKEFSDTLATYQPDMDDGHDDPRYRF